MIIDSSNLKDWRNIMLEITGCLNDYQDGKCIPEVVMAMSIALTKNTIYGYGYFTAIDFEKMDDDEDGCYVTFTATVVHKFHDAQTIPRISGCVRLNIMNDNPADESAVYFS